MKVVKSAWRILIVTLPAVAMIGAQSGKSPEQMYELLRDSGRLSSLRNQLREKLRLNAHLVQLPIARGLQFALFSAFALAFAIKVPLFPLHTWLPETMETPTPVSALMHAGIVNAGGYLVGGRALE